MEITGQNDHQPISSFHLCGCTNGNQLVHERQHCVDVVHIVERVLPKNAVAANQLEDLFYICPDARQVYAAKNRRIIFRFLGTLFSV